MLIASIFLSLALRALLVDAVPLPLPDTGLLKPVAVVVDTKIPYSTKSVGGLVAIMNHAIHTADHLGGSLGHTASLLASSLSHSVDGAAGGVEHLSGELSGALGVSHAHGLDNAGGLSDLWSDFEEKLDSSLTSGDKSDSEH